MLCYCWFVLRFLYLFIGYLERYQRPFILVEIGLLVWKLLENSRGPGFVPATLGCVLWWLGWLESR